MSWAEEQDWEADWWGDCTNTFGEETKQITYADRMGLRNEPVNGQWPVYDLRGLSVVDVGGGPVSMLLKTINGGTLTVVDPCPYPDWVTRRYMVADINYVRAPAEKQRAKQLYDEGWIYNVLQHVEDPEKVISNARRSARLLRIFEWVNVPVSPGHPHELTVPALSDWLGGAGSVEQMDENGCVGVAFYGAFPGTG